NTEKQLELPKADVLKFVLESGSWFCLRPSGTEPKAKVYVGTKATTQTDALAKANDIEKVVMDVVNSVK
ncbi:MAG: phospho-sugar mutase, partial [Culicoidibacterales bacterium]